MDYTVDEHGNCYGFRVDGYVTSFGGNLEGREVSEDDGWKQGKITKVHSHIHTGSSGSSNYVYVEIEWEN